jgi:ANTAR domain/GAF domain
MSTVAAPGSSQETLPSLARILRDFETLEVTANRVANLALLVIPGADYGGFSLMHAGTVQTFGATDPIEQAVDDIQYETGEGPCLSAIKEHVTNQLDDVSTDTRWPKFSPRAAKLNVASLLSFNLSAGEEGTQGAMNLCSATPYAFTPRDRRVGTDFAAHVGAVLAIAQTFELDQDLSRQMHEEDLTREIVGVATGLLVERGDCTPDEARSVFRQVATDLGSSVRDVAQAVIDDSENLAELRKKQLQTNSAP